MSRLEPGPVPMPILPSGTADAVLDALPHPVIMVAADGRIANANSAAESFWHAFFDAAYLAAEKASGRKPPKLGTDAERVAFLFERYQVRAAAVPALGRFRSPGRTGVQAPARAFPSAVAAPGTQDRKAAGRRTCRAHDPPRSGLGR